MRENKKGIKNGKRGRSNGAAPVQYAIVFVASFTKLTYCIL